jgi:molybdate transport system substrate-binding protein
MERRTIVGAAALLAVLAACGRAPSPAVQPVRIFAAASLVDVLEDVSGAFVAEGGAAPVVNLAGSSALARQIEQGADADLFLSADEEWMDYLEARDLIVAGSRRMIAGNSLVLVAPAGQAPFAAASLADLPAALGDGRLAIADPDTVPAGRYAREALRAAGAWDAVSDRLVLGENVRAALAHVESGEAAAGIVYRTDALAAQPGVVLVQSIDPASHRPIAYWMAGIQGDRGVRTETEAFAEFLASGRGRAAFEARGFVLPPVSR